MLLVCGIKIIQLKKITKKAKNKVDDSFIYATNDNKKIEIKPILITRALTYKTSLKTLRKITREFLIGHVKNLTAMQVMGDVINNNLQKDIRTNAKKIMPLANCIIKSTEILD